MCSGACIFQKQGHPAAFWVTARETRQEMGSSQRVRGVSRACANTVPANAFYLSSVHSCLRSQTRCYLLETSYVEIWHSRGTYRVRCVKPRAPPQASHREESDAPLWWIAAKAARGPVQHIQHDHNCEMATILGTDGGIQPEKVPHVYKVFQRVERVSGVERLSDSRSDGEAGHELNTAPSLICQPGRD